MVEWHILNDNSDQFNNKGVLFMIINKIQVSNYKNLVNCEIFPKGLSVLTGCNSSGKSNFIEIFQFISIYLSGSDEQRNKLFRGFLPNGTGWTPEFKNFEHFKFVLDCNFKVGDVDWELSYVLEMSHPTRDSEKNEYYPAQVLIEKLSTKEVGKPGKATEVIHRSKEGYTKVTRKEEPRKREEFSTKSDMSALQALEVREADAFTQRFPVLSEFKKSFLSSNLLRLNPRKLVINQINSNLHQYSNSPGAIIDDFPLYNLLMQIKNGEASNEFDAWLKKLCSIDKIVFHEVEDVNNQKEDKERGKYTYVLIHQFDRVLFPHELSTGCAMILGMLIAIYSLLRGNGFIILEEPEIYLHPKAIIDIVQLLREMSQSKTVLFTTHSPVVLNSMKPEEVTLMVPSDDWKVTTRNVADIKDAIDLLDNGFISFGDLLQTNFNVFEKN